MAERRLRGSMRERSPGRWQLRVSCPPDPVTGRRRVVTRSIEATSARQAEEALDQLRSEVGEGKHTATAQLTVGVAIDRTLEVLDPRWTKQWRSRVHQLMADVKAQLGTTRLDRLKPYELEQLYAWQRTERKLSARSIKHTHTTLRQLAGYWVEWGWIPAKQNPIPAKAPSVAPTDVNPPSADEMATIFTALEDKPADWSTFVRLAAHTGARRGELCAITRSCLDLDSPVPTLRIWRVIAVDDDNVESLREYPKSGAARRRIGLGPSIVARLRELMAGQDQAAVDAGVKMAADPYLFIRDIAGAEHWKPDSVTMRWSRLADDVGLGDIRFHDLRHYMATQALSKGMDVYHVAARLGHANPSITLNTYTHWVPARDAEVALALDEA